MAAPQKILLKFRDENKIDEKENVDSGQELTETYSASQFFPFLKEFKNCPKVNGVSMYSMFMFE